jgi:hypothetical protein
MPLLRRLPLRFNLSRVGFDAHFSGRVHNLSYGPPFAVSVDCLASFLQRIFLGQVHRGEFPVSAMECFGSFRVTDQRVIALPEALLQLMNLQFDFDAFVEFLNHVVSASMLLRARRGNSVPASPAKLASGASMECAILAIGLDRSVPACGAPAKEESVMAGFAEVAAEWTKQQQRQDDKFDRVAASRARYFVATTRRAGSVTGRKRDECPHS